MVVFVKGAVGAEPVFVKGAVGAEPVFVKGAVGAEPVFSCRLLEQSPSLVVGCWSRARLEL